jgi:hypothetical protein
MEPTSPSLACQFDPVTVRLSLTYRDVSWLPAPNFLKDLPINMSYTLPRESDECTTSIP